MSSNEMNGIRYAQENQKGKHQIECSKQKKKKNKLLRKEARRRRGRNSLELDLFCSPWLAASRGALSVPTLPFDLLFKKPMLSQRREKGK